MRIFLDTNVVLTGAFNPTGFAGELLRLCDVTFYHSPRVLAECKQLILRDSSSQEIAYVAAQKVNQFLTALSSQCVPDRKPPMGVLANDPDDELILGAAIGAHMDAICTYNIKDFPNDILKVATPLTLCRYNLKPDLRQYIQPVMLSSLGTLLFFGRLAHRGSMGNIIRSENGIKVVADENGFVRLKGEEVQRCNVLRPLPNNEEFRLAIRYKDTDFEAALWRQRGNGWEKEVLSTGVACFAEKTYSALFTPNHGFSGYVQCLSGLPRYVRDHQLASALDNYSLEAIAGSLDLRWYLKNAKLCEKR